MEVHDNLSVSCERKFLLEMGEKAGHLCKGVQEAGGEIGFETEEGVSTTFWIRLPLP